MSNDTRIAPGTVPSALRVAKVADAIEPLALRPREAEKALGICERTLFDLNKTGEIPCIRIGWAVLYPVETLRAWLQAKVGADVRPPEEADDAEKAVQP